MKNTGLILALGALAYLFMKGSGQGIEAAITGGGGSLGGSTGASDVGLNISQPEIVGSAPLMGGGSLSSQEIISLISQRSGTFMDAATGKTTWAQYDPITVRNIGEAAFTNTENALVRSADWRNPTALAYYSRITNAHRGGMTSSERTAWDAANLPAARQAWVNSLGTNVIGGTTVKGTTAPVVGQSPISPGARPKPTT